VRLIVASIPIFFTLIAIEWMAAKLLDRPVYAFADSIADLGCGIVEQLLGVFVKGALLAGYLWLYANARIATLDGSAWLVIASCFVLVDFCYYWFHRKSHEIGAFWAAHAVHHQSEEYNLAVALRQGAFQSFFSWIFYLPLAVMGFPPALFLTCAALNTLYQFWIHTRLIGKLGPIEWVMNTPSHHRVHHGRNPEYIDRNHAGVFIVWDRLFGTFVEEQAEPVYGVVKPLHTFSPVGANLAGWIDLALVSRLGRTAWDRVRPFVSPPGWRPAEIGGPIRPAPVSRAADPPRRPDYPRRALMGIGATFASMLVAAATFLNVATQMPRSVAIGVALLATVALSLIARRLDAAP
jgi:sterol desaturase/sphingolipid hydroxylase (fatty acid hydroxylase superfamily)